MKNRADSPRTRGTRRPPGPLSARRFFPRRFFPRRWARAIRSTRVGAGLVLLVLSWAGQASAADRHWPRPFSPVERQAVAWVASYLGADGARAEPLPWAGDLRGSTWTLVTTEPGTRGRSESALFEVVDGAGIEHWIRFEGMGGAAGEGGEGAPALRITLLSSPSTSVAGEAGASNASAEASFADPALGSQKSELSAEEAPARTVGQALAAGNEVPLGLLLGALVLVALSFLDRRARPYFRVASVLAIGLALAVHQGWFVGGSRAGLPGDDPEADSTTAGPVGSAATSSTRSAGGREIAWAAGSRRDRHLESAQLALAGRRLAEAETHLAEAGPSLVRELFGARLAFERLDVVDAAYRYGQVLERWPAVDSVLLEATRAYETLDYSDRAEAVARRLIDLRSRSAEVHYYLARRLLVDGVTTRAHDHFLRAFTLRPLHRQQLLEDPVLGFLVFESPAARDLLGFDSAEEPPAPCLFSAEPLDWPAGVEIATLGGLLTMELADGTRLEVPGGCGLAPPGTRAHDAESWRQRREKTVLAQLASLGLAEAAPPSTTENATTTENVATTENAATTENVAGPEPGAPAPGARPITTMPTRTPPVVTVPVIEDGSEPLTMASLLPQSRLAEAVEILARRSDWATLEALTASVPIDALDVESAQLRAHALDRLGRDAEAGQVLVEIITSDMVEQRADPGPMQQLAEWLVTVQQYDRALELLARADELVPYETDGRRLLQVQMERRLFRSAAEETSEHYRLVFPPRHDFVYAEETLAILESERRRLGRWVPLARTGSARPGREEAERVDVLMLEGNDFRASYGGMNIAGLYDGRIRLPLGEMPTLVTEIEVIDELLANLVTHELAHALIAEATSDLAPHWFHEGLAQLVEPHQDRINPIPGLLERGAWIPFPLLEPVLRRNRIPEVAAVAYDQVRWTLYWIQSAHGIRAIHGLLDAFDRGASTEEALAEVLGMTPAEVDAALVRWGREEAPTIWTES